MSQRTDSNTTTIRDIVLSRSVTTDSGEHARVELTLESTSEEPIPIRLEKTFPPDISVQDLQFFGDNQHTWDVVGQTISLETTLSPGETRTTGYTVGSADLVDSALPKLTTEADQPDPLVDRVEQSAATADLIGEQQAEDPSLSTAELVSELTARVNDDSVSDAQLEALQESLGPIHTGKTESLSIRISHLQQRLSDLEAFASPLEAIYEEHGSPDTVVQELHSAVSTLEHAVETDADRLDELEQEVESQAGTTTAIESQLESVDERLQGIEDAVATVETRSTELESQLDTIQDRLDAIESLEEATKSLEKDVEGLLEWQETITSLFENFAPSPTDPDQ